MSIEAVAEVKGHLLNRSNRGSEMNWLGDVPDGWSLLANKYIFKLRKALVGKQHANHVLLSLTLNGVIKRDMENPEGKFPAEFDNYQEVRPGDFVFCLFDVEETPRTVGLSRHHGMITGAYTVMEVQEGFDGAFLYYFYLNLDIGKRLRHLYRGLRNTIPKETFFGFKSFIPPLTEQTRIAAFLDRKCGQIDTAIAQKERLIALLKERRQVLVQQAVTKGLDPQVKMKDSGVPWLGDVPEHWEVKKSKRLFGQRKERARKGDEQLTASQKHGVIPQKLFMELEGRRVTQVMLNADILKHVEADDFVISMRSFQGGIEHSAYAGCISSAYIPLVPLRHVVTDYFKYLLKCPSYITALAGTSDLVRDGQAMRYENFCAIDLIIVPEAEQIEIANYLKAMDERTEKSLALQEAQIAKLKEYRSILINAAVTGKIKVPEV